MTSTRDPRPLVAHVVYRFDVGGLENGVVNLINRMPSDCYRHAVIALTEITDFSARIHRDDVEFVALNKSPGHGVKLYPRLYKLFRAMRPAIVHTRNLAALEACVPACAAGVPVRIHGEHGRDVGDFDGSSRKYQWIRRLYQPFVTNYVTVSRDLQDYVTDKVGISKRRVTHVYNGVDACRFTPVTAGRGMIPGCPFNAPDLFVVGTVGRMAVVKDQLTLARAFIRALQIDPSQCERLRLVMIGEGPLRKQAQALLQHAGLTELAWLPGVRNDVPAILQGLDCFVLPSLGEGISNTVLEAMATSLPVIATDVGGTSELLERGITGELVPAADSDALAERIVAYSRNPETARNAGRAGRARVERLFTIDVMVNGYQDLYNQLLGSSAAGMQRVDAV